LTIYARRDSAADFRPDQEGLHSSSEAFGGGDVITTEVEQVVDPVVGRKEAQAERKADLSIGSSQSVLRRTMDKVSVISRVSPVNSSKAP
jgi:hypothetical protein